MADAGGVRLAPAFTDFEKEVSFDLNPPPRYAGADNKRRLWQEFFAARTGPVAYEISELNVVSAGELAFAHSRQLTLP
jgi:ketosteroid isomerase-like protein